MSTHRLDAIAHPTIDAAPPLIDHTRPPKGPRIRLSVPWSIADFPALSVPAGFDNRGLPVGLSLATIPEREANLLGLGIVIDEDLHLWRHGPPTGVVLLRRAQHRPADANNPAPTSAAAIRTSIDVSRDRG